jgi:putative SbcD/Mre11-related phosphoesterase
MKPEIQPIPNEPALLLKEKKLLVVADLHIGIESELQESGLHVPSQTPLMEQRLIALLTAYDIQNIIILGDIKHMIPSITTQERTDVKRFLSTIQSYATLHVLPGNHDGNIDRLLGPEVQLHPSDGFVFEGIGFAHGHRWAAPAVMQCEQVVIGHSHPLVMLVDRLGNRTFEQCWMRCPPILEKLKQKYPTSSTKQILVMPAFNPLCGGIAINQEKLLGPFGSLIDIDSTELYLLDGCSLGQVKDFVESG